MLPPPQCTLPIFIPRDDRAFRHHGTGTLLSYAGRFFIATAAHVNEGDGSTDELFIGTSSQASQPTRLSPLAICTPIPQSGSRRNDTLDLAIIPILNGDAERLAKMNFTSI